MKLGGHDQLPNDMAVMNPMLGIRLAFDLLGMKPRAQRSATFVAFGAM